MVGDGVDGIEGTERRMSGGGWAKARVVLRNPWRGVTTVRGGVNLSDVSVWVVVVKPEVREVVTSQYTGKWVEPPGGGVESAWFSAANVVAIEWEAGA